jgi:hypothetical protein
MVDHVVEQTIEKAIRIFEEALSEYQAVFALDNSANHGAFAKDALVESNMNLREESNPKSVMVSSTRRAALNQWFSQITTQNIPACRKGCNKSRWSEVNGGSSREKRRETKPSPGGG